MPEPVAGKRDYISQSLVATSRAVVLVPMNHQCANGRVGLSTVHGNEFDHGTARPFALEELDLVEVAGGVRP